MLVIISRLQVCAFYALSGIQDEQWAGLGIISGNTMKLVRVVLFPLCSSVFSAQARSAISELLDALRPEAVALVDAFDIPDRVLNSTIGRYDGNVYEALYEAAKLSNLNDRDPFEGYGTVSSFLSRSSIPTNCALTGAAPAAGSGRAQEPEQAAVIPVNLFPSPVCRSVRVRIRVFNILRLISHHSFPDQQPSTSYSPNLCDVSPRFARLPRGFVRRFARQIRAASDAGHAHRFTAELSDA